MSNTYPEPDWGSPSEYPVSRPAYVDNNLPTPRLVIISTLLAVRRFLSDPDNITDPVLRDTLFRGAAPMVTVKEGFDPDQTKVGDLPFVSVSRKESAVQNMSPLKDYSIKVGGTEQTLGRRLSFHPGTLIISSAALYGHSSDSLSCEIQRYLTIFEDIIRDDLDLLSFTAGAAGKSELTGGKGTQKYWITSFHVSWTGSGRTGNVSEDPFGITDV